MEEDRRDEILLSLTPVCLEVRGIVGICCEYRSPLNAKSAPSLADRVLDLDS